MKKLLLLIMPLMLLLCSCSKEHSADAMLREFVSSYGAEGVIYSSECKEWDDGYLEPDRLAKIYLFNGRFPSNYAILLNSHADYGSECGFFVCDDADMTLAVTEMCLERANLLGGGLVKRSGNVVFYSTMRDGERAEKIFDKIIR